MLLIAVSIAHAASSAYHGPDKPVSEVYRGPDGWAISVRCKDDGSANDCIVAATQNGRSVKEIFSSSQLPGVQWHSDIAMITYPCGSSCRNDMFFSPPDKIDGGQLIDENTIDTRRRLVVSVATNPIGIYQLFTGRHKPIASLRLDTRYTQPDIEKMQWHNDRLVVWYRDDAGKSRQASITIPGD